MTRSLTARELDALEKTTRTDARALQPLAAQILELAMSAQKDIRWHVAQLLPRLRLRGEAQRRRRVEILIAWIDGDPSSIVRVNALQSLVTLARVTPSLNGEVQRRLERSLYDPSAAMRARARILVRQRTSERSEG